jgi:hypothetical protein
MDEPQLDRLPADVRQHVNEVLLRGARRRFLEAKEALEKEEVAKKRRRWRPQPEDLPSIRIESL